MIMITAWMDSKFQWNGMNYDYYYGDGDEPFQICVLIEWKFKYN